MTDPTTLTLTELAAAYRRGELRPLDVTEAYLAKLSPGPVYRLVTAERALEQARRADTCFRRGIDLGPLQGIPLALKDLMDTRGDVTAAGSRILAERPPATHDCPAAQRLDAAGAVFLGKTTMTELAFSGLGLNPHHGTPGNALDPERIPGGSSSGAAVAVATALACAAVGSDTGGSVRIPAAFNALVGLKPTDGSIPTAGCVPLSTTLDTLGPITRTALDAYHLWRALAGKPPAPFATQTIERDLTGLRLFAPTTVLHDALEPSVADAFGLACARLVAAGARLGRGDLPVLQAIVDATAHYGGFAGMESFALYETMLGQDGARMDPRVSSRILPQRDKRAADYIRLQHERTRIQQVFGQAMTRYDALLAPTVAILPPRTIDLAEDAAYFRANAQVLRNTSLFNFLGVPAVSVPVRPGVPVGLMVVTRPQQEKLALQLAGAVEQAARLAEG